MDGIGWEVLDPKGVPGTPPGQVSGQITTSDRSDVVIGFLSNHRPNVADVERALAEMLAQDSPSIRVILYEKQNMARSAGTELLDRIANECSGVINGIGD